MPTARPVRSERELKQILGLQRHNLARNLSDLADGFVSVEHDFALLQRMHALQPSIVAVEGDELAGYALVMPIECREFIPVLAPMFARLDALRVAGRYYVMGQVCVAPAWRGRGVFDLLYEAHRRELAGRFDSVVTEVAVRNARSMRAHERVGFEIIDRYRDETDDWAVIRWRWR